MAVKFEPLEVYNNLVIKTEPNDDGVRGQEFEIEIKVEPIDSTAHTDGMEIYSTGTFIEASKSTNKLDTEAPAGICNFCNTKYNNIDKFKNHMLQHSAEKKYTCTTCKRRYLNKEKLGTHLMRHTEGKHLQCKVCRRNLTERNILENHMFIHSFEEYTCDLCDETFPNKTKVIIHIRKHKGGNVYACSYCKREFETPSGLRAHERTHSGVKPYSCEICGHSFNRLSKLHRHNMREHGGPKPQKCCFCEKTFVRSQDLVRHTATHESNYDSDTYEP